MRRLLFGAAILCFTSVSGSAQSNIELAASLGDILYSEELCGLSFDPAAIERFIAERVPADDIQFTRDLTMMTGAAAYSREGMSASSKAAHCAQVGRVAKSFGFIR